MSELQLGISVSTATRPRLRAKLAFWLLLGALSVFFAEVVSGSYLFPFFTVWGLLVLVPLYSLHLLVLASMAFSRGTPRSSTLYAAGMIFGMYEAYITKVLWSPSWGDALFLAGGVAVVETVVLVLFWHPVMAFVVPLMLGESIGAGSRDIVLGLPARVQRVFSAKGRRLLIALAMVAGLLQSANTPSPLHSVGSVLAAGVVIFALAYVCRKRLGTASYTVRSLLPHGRELWICAGLLALIYVVLGLTLRPEALPGTGPQAMVWLIYAGLFALLYVSLRRRPYYEPQAPSPAHPLPRTRTVLQVLAGFVAASIAGKAFSAAAGVAFFGILWFTFVLCGLALLAVSIRDVVHASQARRLE